ncbi:MAG: sigma-54 dependent transcriptional regulator [Candidatus Cloacimonetes bacterium]|nr:sigma-54 dependent transcriptional regulator [Candidatus Cloacimonadota bacterium]
METKKGRILVVDDNEDILITLKLLLKRQVEKIVTTTNPTQIPALIAENEFDLYLLDMNFSKDMISGQEGFYWLEKILEIDPDAVVIFITAYGDVEKAVKAVKSGALDFVIKPWKNEKLITTVSSALELRKTRLETTKLKNQKQNLCETLNQPFKDFIGVSQEMKNVFKTIQKVAKTDASVLILGDNGTGKELVARALHKNSNRANEVFISVDLGAISETLFESELFGHVKGAFTDAKKDRPGRLEIASGGTLFLDEIGNLSMPLQAKLLTALEKREVIRVGSNKPHPIDIRLISATNMPIYKMANEKDFRQDLLYRINTVEIQIPPLRDRVEDIEPLAKHFLKKYSQKYNKNIKTLSVASIKKLEHYNWPGNIRELQHALERAIIMCESKMLQPFDFLLSEPTSGFGDDNFETYNLEDVEATIIKKVLRKHKGNISQAAKELGLTRTSLYRRLEKYDL